MMTYTRTVYEETEYEASLRERQISRMRLKRVAKWLFFAFLAALAIGGVCGACVIAPWIFMSAWNSFVPAAFHGERIGYWHSVAALVLLAFLAGGGIGLHWRGRIG